MFKVLMGGFRDTNANVVGGGGSCIRRGGAGVALGCEMKGDGKSACMQAPGVLCISNMEKAVGLLWKQIQNPESRSSNPSTPLLRPPSYSPATSQQIWSSDLRPAYLGEQG